MTTKVFLVGYGGMGKAIERVAGEFDVEIVGHFDPLFLNEDAGKGYYSRSLEEALRRSCHPDAVIDFSTAEAVPDNLKAYEAWSTDFVVGTTSWDYTLAKTHVDMGLIALVDQNMHPVLVALQHALEFMAYKYPKVLEGYGLDTKESHQDWKPKPSGTAPVWSSIFQRMGAVAALLKSDRSKKFIHAFHWYTLSKDFIGKAATMIQIGTFIWGREDYARGALQAALYVHELRTAHKENGQALPNRVLNMRDVLAAKG